MARVAGGDLKAAIADYDRALALNPRLAVAYANRGLARLRQETLPPRDRFRAMSQVESGTEASARAVYRQVKP